PTLKRKLEGSTPLARIDYSDRYVRSPLVMRGLLEATGAIAKLGGRGPVPLNVKTAAPGEPSHSRFTPRRVHDNWPSMSEVPRILTAAAAKFGMDGSLEVLDRKNLDHARILRLVWEDKEEWQIHLDEGFGFLRSVDQVFHPF